MNSIKNTKNLKELRRESLDCCLQFLKDFGLCPYVVNKKLAFYVWHTVQETLDYSQQVLMLTNDDRNSKIVPHN